MEWQDTQLDASRSGVAEPRAGVSRDEGNYQKSSLALPVNYLDKHRSVVTGVAVFAHAIHVPVDATGPPAGTESEEAFGVAAVHGRLGNIRSTRTCALHTIFLDPERCRLPGVLQIDTLRTILSAEAPRAVMRGLGH